MKFNIKGRKLGREKLINLVELEGVLRGGWGLGLASHGVFYSYFSVFLGIDI